ncbi:efflux RND transporter permease subunit [Patescibacteria group bacterium]|nr:efflux RND transporter permease subunit [Patescibacteria group bacterium]MBU1890469.1 efflux RND transporter permease subunit [Patescibacteria group bacterium]
MDEKPSLLTRWTGFFLNRYRVTILILVAILITGFWGVFNNQRQDFPPIKANYIFLQATYPGASAADIEQEVVIPIEQVVEGVEGIKSLRSSAGNNFAFISVEMEDVPQTEAATETISAELSKIGLPAEVETKVEILEPTGPSLALGIVGNNDQTTNDLLQYAADVKSRMLSASPDIKKIDVFPKNEFAVSITIDAEKMQAAGLSYELVKNAIQSLLVSLPGGQVEDADGLSQNIIINAPVRSLSDVENISFGPIALSDFAEITRNPAEDESITIGGYTKDEETFAKEAVYLLFYKQDDGDIIRMATSAEEVLNEIKVDKLLPDDVEVVMLYDTSPFIEDTISTLLSNGLLGLVLILVVLLFFINLRTAIVVALIIPLALLITLFVLPMLGYSLNILTLFSMILTLGILVDNAIVIAEGMVHEIEKGMNRYKASLTSIQKLGPAVTAATLTTIVVFIPFASIGGIMGEFMKYIPYTIIIMLLSSYFLAITITPLLGRWLLREQTYEERRQVKLKTWKKVLILPAVVHYGQNFIDLMSRVYRDNMRKVYAHTWAKWLVLIITAVFLFGSIGYFAPKLKFEQFPSNDSDTILVSLQFPTGTPHEDQKDVYLSTMNEVSQLPHFKTAFAYEGMLWATFVPPESRGDDITIHDINTELDGRIETITTSLDPEIKIVAEPAGYGPPEPDFEIIVEFMALDNDTLAAATADLEAYLNEQDGVVEVKSSSVEDLQPAVDVNLDPDKLNQRGVNALAAAGTVNAVFTKQTIGSLVVREDGVSDEVKLEFSKESTDSIDDLRDLIVPTLTGGVVRLDDVAGIEEVNRLVSISRMGSRRVATTNVSVSDDVDAAVFEQGIKDRYTEEKLRELGLQKDSLIFGGIYATFQEDYSNLQIVFILAMILVYLILVNQFNSYIQPGLILFAVPLALIGVFPGLLLVNSSLNMISGLGVIALVGIVVNDAIVLIATYNRYREEYPDETVSERLVRTGHTRFKPIFSTSITTIGGILPLTILDPFWTGLGVSIVAGLIFSTLGTLISIPVMYSVWKSLEQRMKRRYNIRDKNQ